MDDFVLCKISKSLSNNDTEENFGMKRKSEFKLFTVFKKIRKVDKIGK